MENTLDCDLQYGDENRKRFHSTAPEVAANFDACAVELHVVNVYFLFQADISRADLVEEIRRRTSKPWSFSLGRRLILFSCKHKADSSSKRRLDVPSASPSQSILKQLCCPVTKKVYLSMCLLMHQKKSVTFVLGLGTLPGYRSNKEVLMMMGTVLKSTRRPYDHVSWLIAFYSGLTVALIKRPNRKFLFLLFSFNNTTYLTLFLQLSSRYLPEEPRSRCTLKCLQ